ncbi:MAG: hypothetical protein ACRD21_21275 [Vicinamibacteria bacterium]
MRFRSVLLVVALVAAGWFLWHYREYRSCGERFCVASGDVAPLRLESGREVPVLSTLLNEKRHLVINYLTSHARADTEALCTEAKAVWESARARLENRLMDRVVLGPTSPESEFLGMKYGVVPLYTCCVSTYLEAEKDRSGAWLFPQCAR